MSETNDETGPVLLSVGVVLGVGMMAANLVGLLAVLCNRSLWQPNFVYVSSLLTTDLLTGLSLFFFGLNVVPGYTDSVYLLPAVCVTVNSLAIVCNLASSVTLAIISVDRYACIAFPFLYNQQVTLRRAVLLLLFAWLTAILLACGFVYFKMMRNIPICSWVFPIESELYITCGTNFLCIVVSGVMYALISRLALYHLKLVADQAISLAARAVTASSLSRETFHQKLRAVKMFVVIFGVYCLFWGPYLGATTFYHLVNPLASSLLDLLFLVGSMNSLVNVFITIKFNASFRLALKGLFTRK